ncbi:MAG TPA: hypothetical protein P5572_04385 [Phycisphaerae bacterium]|nr:hypothetical protein [Phycisphaerae bacterium]
MKSLWIVFVVLTVLTWGAYVPTVHHGQKALGANSALRAFLFIGLAYFVMAAIVLVGVRFFGMEPWKFNSKGAWTSFIAGALGAVGALGIVFAFKFKGSPLVVPPLVFAGAPIMATFVTMFWDKPAGRIHPLFILGLCMAAGGAALVLRFKPAAHPAPAHAAAPAGAAPAEMVHEPNAG